MRKPISKEDFEKVLDKVRQATEWQIKNKGDGAFVSTHEIVGAIQEEYGELLEELHHNNNQSFATELIDIAIACLWGYASMVKNSER